MCCIVGYCHLELQYSRGIPCFERGNSTGENDIPCSDESKKEKGNTSSFMEKAKNLGKNNAMFTIPQSSPFL